MPRTTAASKTMMMTTTIGFIPHSLSWAGVCVLAANPLQDSSCVSVFRTLVQFLPNPRHGWLDGVIIKAASSQKGPQLALEFQVLQLLKAARTLFGHGVGRPDIVHLG